MNEDDYRGFYDDLKESIDRNDTEYAPLLKYCPKFFLLLCDILKDKRTDWHTRLLVNSALAYFVLPEDILPDSDKMGYLDDLFLTAFVLTEIKNNVDESLLVDNWSEDEDILHLVEDVHDRSKIIIGDNYIDILRLVGLKKYVSLDLNDNGEDYPKRIARLAHEKRELLGLLSFVVSKVYGNARIREFDRLKQFLTEHEDYDEIERLIHLSQQKKSTRKKTEGKTEQKNISDEQIRKKRIDDVMRGYQDD